MSEFCAEMLLTNDMTRKIDDPKVERLCLDFIKDRALEQVLFFKIPAYYWDIPRRMTVRESANGNCKCKAIDDR